MMEISSCLSLPIKVEIRIRMFIRLMEYISKIKMPIARPELFLEKVFLFL